MPVKPGCPFCHQPYLAAVCVCRGNPPAPRLVCACGQPALAVWETESGERPVCAACLALEQSEAAGQPPAAGHAGRPGFAWRAGLPAMGPAAASLAGELTRRELQIASLAHLPDKEIARRLFLSVSTVRWHLRNARRKLGVHRRLEIKYWAAVLQCWMEDG